MKITFEIETTDFPNDTYPEWEKKDLPMNIDGEYMIFVIDNKTYRIKRDLLKFLARVV